MTATTRAIKEGRDVALLVQLMKERAKPFTVTITDGLPRTNPQNALQRKWLQEAATQLGDETAEEKRGWCKLMIGCKILYAENEEFAAEFDRVLRPLPHQTKLDLMMVPFDMAVTRLMNTKQKTAYLDAMRVHFTGLGVQLTDPGGRT